MIKVNNIIQSKFEIKRKLFHLCAIIFPISYYYIPSYITKKILIFLTLGIVALDIARYYSRQLSRIIYKIFGSIMRKKEQNKIFSGSTYMALGFCITSLYFTKNVCIASWLVLIFSDTFSALIGRAVRPESAKKTIHGFVAFAVSAIIISYTYLTLVNCPYSFFTILCASIIAGIFEFFNQQIQLDDNMTIPISFALSLQQIELLNI